MTNLADRLAYWHTKIDLCAKDLGSGQQTYGFSWPDWHETSMRLVYNMGQCMGPHIPALVLKIPRQEFKTAPGTKNSLENLSIHIR